MGRKELGMSENERVQRKLREATELACAELEWHGKRDGASSGTHEYCAMMCLQALATQCGCEAPTPPDMCKRISDHIDELSAHIMEGASHTDDGDARWYLARVAEQCGVDSTTDAGDMANGIGCHIDYLASQCQETRVEPVEESCPSVLEDRVAKLERRERQTNEVAEKMNQRITDLNDRVNDRGLKVARRLEDLEQLCVHEPDSLQQRLTSLHNIVINRGKRINSIQDRVDSFAGRMSQLEQGS